MSPLRPRSVSQNAPRHAWRPAFALACLGTLLLIAASLWPRVDRPVWVLFAPDSQAAARLQAVLTAGGRPLRAPKHRPAVLARFDDAAGLARVRAQGAWLAIDALSLSGCSGRPPDSAFANPAGP